MKTNLKNDKYRKVRGGNAKLIKVFCSNCDSEILTYQKDGNGSLHRCYLNRIISPKDYSSLNFLKETKEMSELTCLICKTKIGTPMKHTDNRLAFRLIKTNFYKKKLRD